MFTMDVPYIPATEPVVVVAQAAESSSSVDYILNECKDTFHTPDPRSAFRAIDPASMLKSYYQSVGRDIDLADVKIKLLEGTTHGNLLSSTSNYGRTTYHYDPSSGFYGDDRAVFFAEVGGKRFNINLVIKVIKDYDEKVEYCPDPVLIKVPSSSANDSANGIIDNPVLGSVTITDLGNGALGYSNINGISLDDNANGYGRYVDLTPGLNEEFLPTSNPYE